MNPFKIHVHNPEESTLVQQLMLKLDYKWYPFNIDVSFTDRPYLYFENYRILHGRNEDMFLEDPMRELTLEQLLDEIENELMK